MKPVQHEVEALKGRTTLTASLRQISPIAMVDLLSQAAMWFQAKGMSKTVDRVDPPQDVARTILERAGEWEFPRIAGVITTPTLRPSGSVLSASGYDAETQLYHVGDASIVLTDAVQDPTRADAEAALAVLKDLLREFPFTSDVSRSVALSGLITPVVRGSMDVAPLHVMRASTAGSGKSYLVDVAAAISSGRPCPASSVGGDEAELEKRLTALLLGGGPLVCVDNVTGELGGDLLCQAVERPIVTLRPFRTTDAVEVPSRATVFATGNNLRVRGDMTRRTIICALDAKLERPELRPFTSNPVGSCRKIAGGTCRRVSLLCGRISWLAGRLSFRRWGVTRAGLARCGQRWCGLASRTLPRPWTTPARMTLSLTTSPTCLPPGWIATQRGKR